MRSTGKDTRNRYVYVEHTVSSLTKTLTEQPRYMRKAQELILMLSDEIRQRRWDMLHKVEVTDVDSTAPFSFERGPRTSTDQQPMGSALFGVI